MLRVHEARERSHSHKASYAVRARSTRARPLADSILNSIFDSKVNSKSPSISGVVQAEDRSFGSERLLVLWFNLLFNLLFSLLFNLLSYLLSFLLSSLLRIEGREQKNALAFFTAFLTAF